MRINYIDGASINLKADIVRLKRLLEPSTINEALFHKTRKNFARFRKLVLPVKSRNVLYRNKVLQALLKRKCSWILKHQALPALKVCRGTL